MSNKRPLLIIPPQYSSFEEMFNSKEYQDFIESEEADDIRISEDMNKIFNNSEKSEYTILVGKTNDVSVLEKFILSHGGQKVL